MKNTSGLRGCISEAKGNIQVPENSGSKDLEQQKTLNKRSQ
jgi:hypothetical protein